MIKIIFLAEWKDGEIRFSHFIGDPFGLWKGFIWLGNTCELLCNQMALLFIYMLENIYFHINIAHASLKVYLFMSLNKVF